MRPDHGGMRVADTQVLARATMTLFEVSTDAAVVLDVSATPVSVTAANRAFRDATGWDADELEAATARALLGPVVAAEIEDRVARVRASGETLTYEVTRDVPAGRRTFEVRMIPLHDEHGAVGHALVVTRDITQLRHATTTLEEVEQIARIGSWSWNVRADVVLWSAQLYEIYGLETGEPVTYERYLDRIHPDDRDLVRATVRAALDAREDFRHQHRVVRPDGTEIVVEGRGRVLVDAAGEPVRMAGTSQDITERVHLERQAGKLAALRASHERALELNDDVVQAIAVARLALTEERPDLALRALDGAIGSARRIVTGLLQDVDATLGPGDLVRAQPSSTLGDLA